MGVTYPFGQSSISAASANNQNPSITHASNPSKFSLTQLSNTQTEIQQNGRHAQIAQATNESSIQQSHVALKPKLTLSPQTNKMLNQLFGAFPNQEQQRKIEWFKSEILKSPLLVENLNQVVAQKQVVYIKIDPKVNETQGAAGIYNLQDTISIDQKIFDDAYKQKTHPLRLIGTVGHEVLHAIFRQKFIDLEINLEKELYANYPQNKDLTEPVLKYVNGRLNAEARAEMEGYNCVNDYLLTEYPNSTINDRLQLIVSNTSALKTPAEVNANNQIINIRTDIYDSQGFAIPAKAQSHYLNVFAEGTYYTESILEEIISTLRSGVKLDLAKLGTNETRIKENQENIYRRPRLVTDISAPDHPCTIDFAKDEQQCTQTQIAIQKQKNYQSWPDDQAIPTPRPNKSMNNSANSDAISTGHPTQSHEEIFKQIQLNSRDPSLHLPSNQINTR